MFGFNNLAAAHGSFAALSDEFLGFAVLACLDQLIGLAGMGEEHTIVERVVLHVIFLVHTIPSYWRAQMLLHVSIAVRSLVKTNRVATPSEQRQSSA